MGGQQGTVDQEMVQRDEPVEEEEDGVGWGVKSHERGEETMLWSPHEDWRRAEGTKEALLSPLRDEVRTEGFVFLSETVWDELTEKHE